MSSQRAVSDLAYALWEARGRPEGSADVDWIEAERQVLGKRSSGAEAAAVDGSSVDAVDKWTEVKAIAGREQP